MDDLIIYSKNKKDYEQYVKAVLQQLHNAGL